MTKYKQARKPKYTPLTRFIFARGADDFPPNIRKHLKRKNVRYSYTTTCPFCDEESLLVFYVDDPENPGTYSVCGNPQCETYGELEWDPSAGGP